jgi:effector-binding domain-containing protein
MDMQNLDIEAGFPVSRPMPGRGEVQACEIPGGPQASVIHTGPYQGCSAAYEALSQFIQANSREPSGVAYEFYLNDPITTQPEHLQMQIVFPLK